MANPKTVQAFDCGLVLSSFKSFREWQEAAGVDRTTFFNARSGKYLPRVDTAIWIARAAGVTVEQLFGPLVGEPNPNKSNKRKEV